jgi:tripartite-type tricarboxylate transporter receptor subunit TctC
VRERTTVRAFLGAATSAAIAIFAPGALAQDYPVRPVRMVVGVPTGGTTDILARIVSIKLGERLGRQIVVDNRPGASGIIAIDLVAKSQPDGYTVLIAGASISAVGSLYRKVPFDVAKDLAPIALIALTPFVFVVHPSMPARSVAEFLAYAKANPGKLNYAGSASGTIQHLSGELLKRMTGIDMLYVPYKGTGAVLPDLLAGRLQAALENVLTMKPLVRSGALRGLAVTSAARSPAVPELPTIAESGVPGFQAVGWFGIFAAAGTPQEIVRRLNTEISKLMNQPDLQTQLLAQGAEPRSGPPDDLRRHLGRDMEVWGKVIRDGGLKAD